MELKIIEAAAKRLAKSSIENRPSLSSFSAVVDYCRTAMAFLDHEEFRVLFLDKKNHLIADEVQGVGTVDHAPVYPREIMRRALELSATGDPQTSTDDIHLTHQIIAVGKPLKVAVHDHLIIGKHGHVSLKGLRMIYINNNELSEIGHAGTPSEWSRLHSVKTAVLEWEQ